MYYTNNNCKGEVFKMWCKKVNTIPRKIGAFDMILNHMNKNVEAISESLYAPGNKHTQAIPQTPEHHGVAGGAREIYPDIPNMEQVYNYNNNIQSSAE